MSKYSKQTNIFDMVSMFEGAEFDMQNLHNEHRKKVHKRKAKAFNQKPNLKTYATSRSRAHRSGR